MNIELNGEPVNVKATTLEGVMHELGHDNQAVATAVNGTFVPATERSTYTLSEGDRIEIVAPMQGG